MPVRRSLPHIAVAFIAATVLAGCAGSDNATSAAEASVTNTPEAVPTQTEPPTAELETSSSCQNDYPVVLDPTTRSVIATAYVSNVGGRTATARVRVQWYPVGLEAVTMSKTVTVEPGDKVRVNFSKKMSQSVMTGMVGLQHGDEMCTVDASLAR
jgi:hypothetical protein